MSKLYHFESMEVKMVNKVCAYMYTGKGTLRLYRFMGTVKRELICVYSLG